MTEFAPFPKTPPDISETWTLSFEEPDGTRTYEPAHNPMPEDEVARLLQIFHVGIFIFAKALSRPRPSMAWSV